MSTSGSNAQSEKLLRLIDKLIDDSIDSTEFQRLTELIADDPEALATYSDYLNVHAALRQNFRSHSELQDTNLERQIFSNQKANQAASSGRMASLGWLSYFAAIAATLLIAGVIAWSVSSPSSSKLSVTPVVAAKQKPTEEPAVSKAENIERVAVLTRLVDVVWDKDSEDAELGKALSRQKLSIQSGLMQVEFYCGAAVIIEGPAAFELVAPDRGYAHYGKLRAHVPARAKGFTIGTESGEVIDLGTEFGLDITRDGLSELHVIDGEVDFQAAGDEQGTPQRLVGGQAIEVANDGEPHRLIDSDASRFINHSELSARAHKNNHSRYEDWLDYHARLNNDPALVANYKFDDSEGWGRTLVNAAPMADQTSYGAIVGASWQPGRWPTSKALRFRSPSDRVRIKLDGHFDALTMACWVNVRELAGKRSIALLHPEIVFNRNSSDKQRFLHWTLNPTPKGAVLHFSESLGHETGSRNHYSSGSHGIHSNDLGHWVHLAVTYDPVALEVSHYRDGKLVGSKPIDTPRQLGIGVADLCNWPYREWAANTPFEFRNLDGLMDEFVVLARALTPDEIREMFAVGQP